MYILAEPGHNCLQSLHFGFSLVDAIPMTKVKDTWKGRMARTFRRVGSASMLSSADRPVITVRAKGTFDVPIELCVPSTEIEVTGYHDCIDL